MRMSALKADIANIEHAPGVILLMMDIVEISQQLSVYVSSVAVIANQTQYPHNTIVQVGDDQLVSLP